MTRSSRILIVQIAAILVSLSTAWALRFEFTFPYAGLMIGSAPILLLIRLAALGRAGLLHGYWHLTGINDALDLAKAVAIGTVGFAISIRYVLGLHEFPLSIYLLEAITTATLLGGIRVAARVLRQRSAKPHSHYRRVLIVGAGFASQMLIRELSQPESGFHVVGCLDDDPAKRGMRIQGVEVLAAIKKLPEIINQRPVHEVLIAIPSATGAQMRSIVQVCEQAKLKFRTIPSLHELVRGRATVRELRDVNLEDLLGRDPVQLDMRSVRDAISGQCVLVTGAAGSIGSELCAQILTYRPQRLICVDHDETALFNLQSMLARRFPAGPVTYCVSDFRDRRIINVMRESGVRLIIHAAAYKHVPLMESNLVSALRNNVFGLQEFVDAAESGGCTSFLLISSDKAVHPSSFMGATKRIGELLLASRPAGRMRCVAVRFGNVLGSQGSVVPLLQQQILTDRRVCITHPEVTRFFMTVPEAVSLVLQALTVARNRDILVLDMGAPVKIVDLAMHLIRLTSPAHDSVQIVFTGLRKGEKLHEELFYAYEQPCSTDVPKIRRAQSSHQKWERLSRALLELRILAESGSDVSLRFKVQEIVPEYNGVPSHGNFRTTVAPPGQTQLALMAAD